MPVDDPSVGKRITDAQTRGYSDRKVAETLAKAQEAVAGIDLVGRIGSKAFDLLIELVRVSVANPIAGAASSIIVADILARAGIISANAEGLVDGIALGVVGVSLGTQVAGAATNIIDSIDPFDIFKNGPQPTNDLAPTATVVVFGNSTDYPRALPSSVSPRLALPTGA
jgi:hypothetical protein